LRTGDYDANWKREMVNPTKGYGFIQPQGGGNDCPYLSGRTCWLEQPQ
jgi:hypothetical protein